MGGCSIILFLPLLMGVGFAMVVLPIALWIYVVWAVIMLVLVLAVYIALSRRGVFRNYGEDTGWKHYAARGTKWVLIISMVYLLLTGGAAAAFQFMGMKTLFGDNRSEPASEQAADARSVKSAVVPDVLLARSEDLR